MYLLLNTENATCKLCGDVHPYWTKNHKAYVCETREEAHWYAGPTPIKINPGVLDFYGITEIATLHSDRSGVR